jgi:predicted permease
MPRFIRLWRNLVGRSRVERDLDEELRSAFDLLVNEKLSSGLPPDEARRTARLELGGLESVKDNVRDARAGGGVDALLQDLRYGVRILRRNPTFSLVAILTLALGTGANAAVFQLMNALRLRALPVEKPAELVSIGVDRHGKGRVGRGYDTGRPVPFSEPLWQEIRSQQQAFSSLLAWGGSRWDLSTEGEVVWAQGFYVSGGYFRALGVGARVGRLLSEADDQKGCGSPGAVLSFNFWRSRYGGHTGVIGQTIMLDRFPFTVIGVTPPGFLGVEAGRAFDVMLPLCAEPMLRGNQSATGRRDAWWLDIMGRLKPDWTIESAQAHLNAISPSVFQATVSPGYKPDLAKNYTAFTLTAAPAGAGVSVLPPEAYQFLWVLLGTTGVVLLLTCANLANLMLARSTARSHEFAVRLAIGATRRRLIGQLLSENALIAGAGALGGLLLARGISRMLVTFLNGARMFPSNIVVDLTPDWRVLALVTLVAVCVCLFFGLSPALRASRRSPAAAMQPGGRSTTDAHEAVALRRGLVVAQIALSMVLVVGAVLFGRTLNNLGAVDLGFDPDVVVAAVDLRRTAVQPPARIQAFADIVAGLQRVPGVRYAAETVIVPLGGADWNGQIAKGGVVQHGDVHFNAVGDNFFRVMETPLLKGRMFDGRDRPGVPRTVVVNETFARRYFANVDPLGQTFELDIPRTPKPVYSIVGLVRDAKFRQVREERTAAVAAFSDDQSSAMFLPIVYLPIRQEFADFGPADLRVIVRADLPASSLTPALARAITTAVPGAAVSFDAVSNFVDRLLVPQRLMAWLSGFFGVLAMLIASIGLYGVIAYLVTRRRIEIGVRMALGAEPRRIIRMVLSESGMLLAAGVAAGTALAVVASRFASSLLYGLEPLDPVSFALGIGALAVVVLFAAWFPAYRASKVSPSIALRE